MLLAGCAATAGEPGGTAPLLDKAREQGSVLVVVTLRAPAGADPATIHTVKDAVLAEIAATRHRVVRALGNLPQVVLEASEETLRVLAASANVVRIDESLPRRPTR
jgi:hypothetical protein